jgi:hypothetical protein
MHESGTADRATLDRLRAAEDDAKDDAERLTRIDGFYRALVTAAPLDVEKLLAHQRFRLRHLPRLPRSRTRVILGGTGNAVFPNLHAIPLLRVADVVSLTSFDTSPREPERLSFDLFGTRLPDLVTRMPEGFVPDLFFDHQVENGHLVPAGLEDAPCPTVAAVCHMVHVPSIAHVCRLFDAVLPLSRRFAPRLRALGAGHIIDLPFGLNWASFDHVLAPGDRREVDVALTFDDSCHPVYADHRRRTHEIVERVRRATGGRFRFVTASGLTRRDYYALLRTSRIVLNVPGIHGPYNYRTCEAMNAGALLLQHRGDGYAVRTEINDYFEDGRHLVSFGFDDLEARLLHYLEHAEAAAEIARAGSARLREDYGYERLYRRLFAEVRRLGPRADRPSRAQALGHLGLLYWHQPKPAWRRLGVFALAGCLSQPPGLREANLMLLLPTLCVANDREAVLQLMAPMPEVREAFRAGDDEGITLLWRHADDHPVTRWNHAMLRAERGVATRDEMEAALAALEEATALDFDPMQRLVHEQARPPGIDAEALDHARHATLLIPLLACDGSQQAVAEVHLAWMRWLAQRWLDAEAQPA